MRKSIKLHLAITTAYVLLSCTSTPVLEAQGSRSQVSGQYTQVIGEIFSFIQSRYVDEVDPKVLFEGAMNGMFEALGDVNSSYLTEKDMADLSDTTECEFGGVGLYISKPNSISNGKPPYVEVASPIEDTPGWKAQINPGDLIIQINGKPTDSMTMDEVLAILRGKVGEQVNLLIRRGEKLEFPVTLTRAIIEVPTTKAAMIDDIGYLKLLTFTPHTVDRAKEAFADFKQKNYKALILDLRNNYGGLLNSAIGICDLFLDGGVVVTTKSRIPSENATFTARRSTTVPADLPVIVLINHGSASASEIVAGALKDRSRAYIVGEKSFGKGSVQQVFPLDKAGFKITVARYYTPSDVNIDKIGIPPDREVLFPEWTDADAGNLAKLIEANIVPTFVKDNPNATATQLNNLASRLSSEYNLDQSLLLRFIRNEQNRTVIAPIYDLEYDVQLQEAVNILKGGTYSTLMKTAKTLHELQEEAEKEELAVAS